MSSFRNGSCSDVVGQRLKLLLLVCAVAMSMSPPVTGFGGGGGGVAAATCPELEREVLLDFKKSSISEDSNNVLGDWGKEKDCCKWAGIKCDPKTGNVVELILNPEKKSFFSGTVMFSKLQLLPELRVLDLSYGHNLTGRIPAVLGQKLTKLENLNLRKNRIMGPIPATLDYLHLLSCLDLSDNELTDDIPDLTDTQLKYLNLSGNRLTEEIPDVLGDMPALTVLSLSYNAFTGGFPESFLRLGKLAVLSLEHNRLSGSLPEKIGLINNLRSLVLSHNKFQGEFPESMGDLRFVSTLRLDNNEFRGKIPFSFSHFQKLVSFDVSNNRLSGEIPQVAPIKDFPKESFAGNPGLCGHPLPACNSSSSHEYYSFA